MPSAKRLTQCTSRFMCVAYCFVFVCLIASMTTKIGLAEDVDVDDRYHEGNEDVHDDYYDIYLPPLPPDSPYPLLLHERDVIRYVDIDHQFLNIGGGTHASISLAQIQGAPSNELVVVKTFRNSKFSQIMMEARLHRHIEKLNIAPKLIGLLPTGSTSANISLVYEYIPYSKCLHDWINHEPSLTSLQTLEVLIQVVELIRLVHSYDIIFNDLHRGNIVVQKRGGGLKAFIIDFGLASYKQGIHYGNYNGSLDDYSFMAPEIKMNGKTTKASDVYSIGNMFSNTAEELEIQDLVPLSRSCMSLDPEDRPSLNVIERKLREILFKLHLLSLPGTWPDSSTPGFLAAMSFDERSDGLKMCSLQDSIGSKPVSRNSTVDMDVHVFEEPAIWKWLMVNKHMVYSQCPMDLFVLDYFEVVITDESLLIQNSSNSAFIVTRLKSTKKTVIVKQFHDNTFARVRHEACVTAILGVLDVTPRILGILPDLKNDDRYKTAFVQEYFGAGVTLFEYAYRIRSIAWGYEALKRASTDLFMETFNVSLCRDCCRHLNIDSFWELINTETRRFCHIKSHRQIIFENVAKELAKMVELVHRKKFIINNLNEHNILVQWNEAANVLDVRLIDLNRISDLDGDSLDTSSNNLWQFPFLAPEVARGGMSSTKSDVYSLCHVLHWLLGDFLSNNARKIRNNRWSTESHPDSNPRSKVKPSLTSERCVHGDKLPAVSSQRYDKAASFRLQRLEVVLIQCLTTSKDNRPSLHDILDILSSL